MFATRLKPIDTRTIKPPDKAVEPFYSTKQWKETARAIRERDGYRCVKCGSKDSRLFVDHIVERKDGGPDFAHDNLETLCSPCHVKKTLAERAKRGAIIYG